LGKAIGRDHPKRIFRQLERDAYQSQKSGYTAGQQKG
jgi:hypothetical protein